jgi:hypothetical protein
MDPQASKTPVVIETSRYQIVGNVSVPSGMRLSDYVNEAKRVFFAVTEAQIAPLGDLDRERAAEFVLVNRQEIAVLLPAWEEQKAGVDRAAWAFDELMADSALAASEATAPASATPLRPYNF